VGSAGVVGTHDAALVAGPVVVVGRKGSAGAVHLMLNDCWPIDTTYFIRVPLTLDPSFLSWQLTRADLRSRDSSTAVPSLRRPDLEATEVVVASLEEQKRIVAAIEESFSHLDAATAATASVRKRVARFSDALLTALFDPNWRRVPLDSVNMSDRPICYGILKPKTSEPGVVPYVEVRSIAGGRVKVDELRKTTLALHREFLRSELRAGDVVLAIRGSFDRAAVVPECLRGANLSRDVARIAPTGDVVPEFLSAFLASPEARRFFTAHARGVAVRGINIGDLRRLPVPLPSMAEQTNSVRQILDCNAATARIDGEVRTAERRGRQLRRSLLTAAFSGSLVSQDPNDEPASVLLNRAAAERAASTSTRPKRR